MAEYQILLLGCFWMSSQDNDYLNQDGAISPILILVYFDEINVLLKNRALWLSCRQWVSLSTSVHKRIKNQMFYLGLWVFSIVQNYGILDMNNCLHQNKTVRRLFKLHFLTYTCLLGHISCQLHVETLNFVSYDTK